jgi:hypothetical protein
MNVPVRIAGEIELRVDDVPREVFESIKSGLTFENEEKVKAAERLRRFFSKLKRHESGCLVWTAARHNKGYGEFVLRTGVKKRVHRLVWEIMNGPIPKGLQVLHTCDNPPCCEPTHLFLGTNLDNQRDMRAKGRDSKPPVYHRANHPNAKLTEADVAEIRDLLKSETQASIATRFGVCPSTIGYIKRGDTWA